MHGRSGEHLVGIFCGNSGSCSGGIHHLSRLTRRPTFNGTEDSSAAPFQRVRLLSLRPPCTQPRETRPRTRAVRNGTVSSFVVPFRLVSVHLSEDRTQLPSHTTRPIRSGQRADVTLAFRVSLHMASDFAAQPAGAGFAPAASFVSCVSCPCRHCPCCPRGSFDCRLQSWELSLWWEKGKHTEAKRGLAGGPHPAPGISAGPEKAPFASDLQAPCSLPWRVYTAPGVGTRLRRALCVPSRGRSSWGGLLDPSFLAVSTHGGSTLSLVRRGPPKQLRAPPRRGGRDLCPRGAIGLLASGDRKRGRNRRHRPAPGLPPGPWLRRGEESTQRHSRPSVTCASHTALGTKRKFRKQRDVAPATRPQGQAPEPPRLPWPPPPHPRDHMFPSANLFISCVNSSPVGPGPGGGTMSGVPLSSDGTRSQGLCTLESQPRNQQPTHRSPFRSRAAVALRHCLVAGDLTVSAMPSPQNSAISACPSNETPSGAPRVGLGSEPSGTSVPTGCAT